MDTEDYYIFRPKVVRYRNQEIAVDPITPMGTLEFVDEWIKPAPLHNRYTAKHFDVNLRLPLIDNFDIGSVFNLYSLRLIYLLSQAGVIHETFPAVFFDRVTGVEIGPTHKIFHLLESRDAVDRSQSIIHAQIATPMRERSSLVEKIVFKKDILLEARPLFYIEGFFAMAMHKSLKASLEKVGITGCRYTSIDVYWR